MLQGKKVAIFGERDDVSGSAIRRCMEAAGAEVLYEATSCFVWTSAGSAGLAEQEDIKKLTDANGVDGLIVVLGINQTASLRILATTFASGDPGYAGALGGVALGLPSYHIFELKDEIPADVWATEMAFKELELEDETIAGICEVMAEVRSSESVRE